MPRNLLSEACLKIYNLFVFNLLATITSENNLRMSAPPPQGDAKVDKTDQTPPIKREFSRKFYTTSKEDILNNRVGPNVSKHIHIYLLV